MTLDLAYRLWCTACAAVAVNGGLAFLLGFPSLQAFWGLS